MTSPLANNRAVVIAAHPNRNNLKVSDMVSDLGLNVLRAVPAELNATSIPDLPQARYGDYLHNLSAFMFSSLHDKVASTASPTFLITWQDSQKYAIIPVSPPKLVIAWNQDPPEETLAQIREKMVVSETVSGGKMALEFKPDTWGDLELVKPYKSNIRATAPVGYVNIKAFNIFRQLVLIISVLVGTQRYPAFIDKEHYVSIKAFVTKEQYGDTTIDGIEQDVEMKDGDKKTIGGTEYSAPFGDSDLKKKPGYMLVDMRKCSKIAVLKMESATVASDLPDGYGLWLPYFSQVSHFDKSTVPDFFDRYLQRSVGDDLEEITMNLRLIRSEWGVCAETGSGKEFTHLVWSLELALKAQAQLIPIYRGSVYRGCIISGAGFTIDVAGKAYRPVPKEDLVKSIVDSDIHSVSLEKIGTLLGHSSQKADALKCTTMNQLRKCLVASWTKEAQKDDIMRHAKYLSFPGDSHWPVNETTIEKALQLIRNPNTSSALLPNDIPVHYSTILETDVTTVVWSAFGGMAPSFRIPGGHEFDLKDEMEVEQKLPGGAIRTKKIVRIAVRMKSLNVAVEDLKTTLSKQTIVNPLSAPKVRASQQYQDKMFQAEKGKILLSSLRVFCGISLTGDSTGKRKAEGGSEPAKKKSRIADMDGW